MTIEANGFGSREEFCALKSSVRRLRPNPAMRALRSAPPAPAACARRHGSAVRNRLHQTEL